MYEQLIQCDVIVYDITENPEQIDEAVWAVSGTVYFNVLQRKLRLQIAFSAVHRGSW